MISTQQFKSVSLYLEKPLKRIWQVVSIYCLVVSVGLYPVISCIEYKKITNTPDDVVYKRMLDNSLLKNF